jgi:hypothetical protein
LSGNRVDQNDHHRYDEDQHIGKEEVKKPGLAVHFPVCKLVVDHSQKGIVWVHQGFEKVCLAVAVHDSIAVCFRLLLVDQCSVLSIHEVVNAGDLRRKGLYFIVLLL